MLIKREVIPLNKAYKRSIKEREEKWKQLQQGRTFIVFEKEPTLFEKF